LLKDVPPLQETLILYKHPTPYDSWFFSSFSLLTTSLQDYKRFRVLFTKSRFFTFFEQFVNDVAVDQGFGFIDEMFKVFQVDLGANEEKVDLMRVFSPGKIARYIGFFNGSQMPEHFLDDLVKSDIFPQDII